MNNPGRPSNTLVAAMNTGRSLWLAWAFAAAAQTGGFLVLRAAAGTDGTIWAAITRVYLCYAAEDLPLDAAGGTQGALLREASRMQACAGMASVPGGLTLDRIEQGGNDNGKAE